MPLRKMLLSLTATTGLAGAVHAAPPVNPVPEGREPNPVTREFYLTEPVPHGYAAPAPSAQAPATGDWLGVGTMWGKFVGELSMPLGTAPVIVPVWY